MTSEASTWCGSHLPFGHHVEADTVSAQKGSSGSWFERYRELISVGHESDGVNGSLVDWYSFDEPDVIGFRRGTVAVVLNTGNQQVQLPSRGTFFVRRGVTAPAIRRTTRNQRTRGPSFLAGMRWSCGSGRPRRLCRRRVDVAHGRRVSAVAAHDSLSHVWSLRFGDHRPGTVKGRFGRNHDPVVGPAELMSSRGVGIHRGVAPAIA